MRTSNYHKTIEINIDKKAWKMIAAAVAVLILAGVIFFFTYFRVEYVEVMDSSYYTEAEVKEMALRGPMAGNSVLAPMLYTTEEVGDIAFVEGFTVTQINRNTICVSVKEKQIVGCIPYLDSYIYFDREGYFIESSKIRDEAIPFFDGIQVNQVVKDAKLPIKGSTVLNTAVALATIFEKNQTIPDHIQFDDNYHINLIYGDIIVQLGEDELLEDKMSRAIAILPTLMGKKGILHLETVTENNKKVTFEEEEIIYTAENWPGGYDEYGGYDGYSEYDQYGNHVGPKPKSELDYAIENWIGGYDEEWDYTGYGNYDEYGNYVGEYPSQELLDSFGDWKGGYNENGGFDGKGEYDREGNYVGPNPNISEESEAGQEESDSGDYYDENYYDDSYDNGYDDYYDNSYDAGYYEDNSYDSYY